MNALINTLAGLVAVILVFAPHEFAHALVAYKCGDPTAKFCGRLTLNPLKHLDITGFLLCVFTGFGWAKPVPINPNNFHKYKSGLFFTSIAGVIANFIVAFLAYPLFLVIFQLAMPAAVDAGQFAIYATKFGATVFSSTFLFSLGVFVFNLLPLHPLDGFRIIESCTREVNPVRRFLKNYGTCILIILVLESFLCGVLEEYTTLSFVKYLDILGYLQWFAVRVVGFPITALWNTVFGLPFDYLTPALFIYAY